MTLLEYKSFADELAQRAGVENGLHQYFLLHRDRLWQTASHFNLWKLRGRKILEIGPFFSYTPFALRKQGNEVYVLEGDDPAVYPLRPLYEAQGIEFTTCNLFENFGSPPTGKHRLPYAADQFDLVSCWETMEHFNFNPIGFIRDLPHSLVAAFHATLEETAEADLLLHVVDSASPDRDQQMAAVSTVLAEIGAGEVAQIVVWNKIDLTAARPAVERDDCGSITRVRVSSKSGTGLDLLRQVLAETARQHALGKPSEAT